MNRPSVSYLLVVFLHLAGLGLIGIRAAPGDWQVLFDGRDFSAWKTLQKPADVPVGWVIEDGAMASRKGCGNLVTRDEFADFELELEWKISAGGNSGLMFRVDESGEKPWHTGPEVQILDDARHKDGKFPNRVAGSLYDLLAPARAAARPVGEWNQVRLRAQGPSIRCWLNGELVIDAEIGSPAWNELVAKSKFAPFPRFGRVPQGRVLLQDHGDPVWFRAIRIRRL